MSAKPTPDAAELVQSFQTEDPALSPEEKETIFRFARDQERLSFHTDERGIGRRLAAHPHSDVETVRVLDDGLASVLSPEQVTDDLEVVAVTGTLPVGAVTLSRDIRRSGGHAEVVARSVLEEVTGR